MVEATLGSRQCKGFAVLAAMRRERAAPADGNVDEIENGLIAMQEDLRVSVMMLYLTGNLGCYYRTGVRHTSRPNVVKHISHLESYKKESGVKYAGVAPNPFHRKIREPLSNSRYPHETPK